MRHLFFLAAMMATVCATDALAQSQAPTDAKRPGYSVQQQGSITSILVYDPDLLKQLEQYQILRTRPATEDGVIVPWLVRNSAGLSPIFTYELARRLWDQGRRDEAFEWYAVAGLRAFYDGFRCTDTTAAQGVMFLPQAAINVAQGIDAHRIEYGRAGLRALKRADLFTSTVSPWWICTHGVRAIQGALGSQTMETASWLKPQAEWPGIRDRLVSQRTEYYLEQEKPQDDPVPMAKVLPPAVELDMGEIQNIAWLDSEGLIIGRRAGDARAPMVLQLWRKSDGGLREVARHTGTWCAGNGTLSHLSRHEDVPMPGQPTGPGQPRPAQIKRTFELAGPPGKMTEQAVGLTSELRRAGVVSAAPSLQPIRQSPYDCRWVNSPRLTGTTAQGSSWFPLLPGHGFLSAHRADGQASEKLLHYASETATPTELPVAVKDVVLHNIVHAAHRDAYFIPALVGPRKADEALPGCRNVWWFKPGRGVEAQCVATDALDRQPYSYLPVRSGILRVLSVRRTPHGDKPGGLYLTTTDGRNEKIHEGRIMRAVVSPDGCGVAIRSYQSLPGKEPPITVLNLCDGPTSRR